MTPKQIVQTYEHEFKIACDIKYEIEAAAQRDFDNTMRPFQIALNELLDRVTPVAQYYAEQIGECPTIRGGYNLSHDDIDLVGYGIVLTWFNDNQADDTCILPWEQYEEWEQKYNGN